MNPSFSLNTYLMGLKPKPYSPIHGFHSSGTSAGFGPGSRASGDCPSEEHAERRLRKRATANCLIKRDRNLSSTPGFLFRGPAFDQVAANMIAESRRGGDLNRATGRDFDRRVDDVLFPIAFASGNIAGQRVAGQRSDRDVVSAADTALEHAAAPNWNVAGEAERLDLAGAGVAADAAYLDVDDACSAEIQSSFSIAEMTDRLIEAQRSLQMPLELCVIGDVIPPERLLHHQEVKFVEALQMFPFHQRVS